MINKIFFSADAHGSTLVWKKWLQAQEIYNIDTMMLCGDLTGKTLIPIIEQGKGKYEVFINGKNESLSTKIEIQKIAEKLSNQGSYYFICNDQEIQELRSSAEQVNKLFKDKIRERMIQWMELLINRVDLKKTKVIIMPGNDDGYEIDSIIKNYNDMGIIWCSDKVVEIDEIEIVSLAHVNPTPWNTPREAKENELSSKIENLVFKLHEPKESIFNFHSPPYGTRLDLAPELDKNKKPVILPGQLSFTHVGSKAVRKAIEKYQPILSLHGHIHESPGVEKIGRTVCVNPGSEYSEGILRGYIIEIENKNVKNYWKVEG